MLQLHTARMENPDTPKSHPNISDFHEYHWNTHIHPPDIPQTPQDISREIKMSTDDNRRQQTPPDTLRHWQVLFEYVWRCLLARVVVCWHLEFLGHVWGVSGGCLGVSEWYSWTLEVLRCVWGVSGFSVLTLWSCNTTLTQPWKAQLFSPDHNET